MNSRQTAVEWLVYKLNLDNTSSKTNLKLIKQAKEMERHQQDKFAIDFYDWCNSEEALDLIQDLQIVGELNKIFTTKELLEIFKKQKGL